MPARASAVVKSALMRAAAAFAVSIALPPPIPRTTSAEWTRAASEINQFESQLIAHGIVLVKYWIHITRDEQLRRFRAREQSAYKRWKLTDEDWRNRKQWAAYEVAVNDMVERTSTRDAPWTLVEANDKYFARLKVLETVCERLEAVV